MAAFLQPKTGASASVANAKSQSTHPKSGDTLVLLRAQAVDSNLQAFASAIAEAAAAPVAYLLDERDGPVDSHGRAKVSVTGPACAALGLFCPPDFAWRCGDYGLYLAAAQYPDVRVFWMIEHDVRFVGGDVAEFFQRFAPIEDVDLICADVRAAERDWYWFNTAQARDAQPRRCFFPVTRFSRRALDLMARKRCSQGRSLIRQWLWPNDEAFAATTLAAAGLRVEDLNAFGATLYEPDSFSFHDPFEGETFDPAVPGLRLAHPVLFGQAYRRKQQAQNPESRKSATHHRLRRWGGRLARMVRW